ncbi:MAG: dTDP-4-dehydrorhamnose reductase [Ruminococcus sp.]|nr:dTDP-4-dehydrorhamnose reductase [Ruminococcus sp.]
MNILITGANGQLGKELIKCFDRGYTELGTPGVLKRENNITAVDVDRLDITDIKAVREFFAGNGEGKPFDAVINCAAFTNVDGCESNFDAAFGVNALGARNLAMACGEAGAKLIHVSTDYVFDGEGSSPKRECDIPCPKSAYGKTKLMGEEYVREFCRKYFIVRTAWLYGYEGKNFVKTMIGAGRKSGRLTVVDDQRGNPTNAADLAHHLIKLLDSEEYGVYHATGAGECSWCEFAREIIRLAGVDAQVAACTSEEYAAAHPEAANRPKYSALDSCMLRVTVGDEFREWREALRGFFDNFGELPG